MVLEPCRGLDEPQTCKAVRQGWRFGDEEYRKESLEQMGQRMGPASRGPRAAGNGGGPGRADSSGGIAAPEMGWGGVGTSVKRRW